MPTEPKLVRQPTLDHHLDQSHFGCRTSRKKFLSRRWSFATHRLLTSTLPSTLLQLDRVLNIYRTSECVRIPLRTATPDLILQSAHDTLHHLRMRDIKVHLECAGGYVHILKHLHRVRPAFVPFLTCRRVAHMSVAIRDKKCVSCSAD